MPRKRDPRRDEAKQEWLKANGDIKLVDLAEQFEVTSSTIRKWKAQDKWQDELKGSAPIPKKSAPKQKGGQPNNKNATGNRGGAPVGNDNATSHGFFRTIFPDDDETMGIVENIMEKGPVDMLWENIVIKYTAIARAQKLMHVQDPQDHGQLLKKEKYEIKNLGDGKEKDYQPYPVEREYEVQFSWDRHANMMTAQARAMSELRSLIKDFLQLSGQDDQRRLQLEKMRKEIENIDSENQDSATDDWVEGVRQAAEKRRQLKDGEDHE